VNFFKRLRVRYILHRHPITHTLWQSVEDNLSLLQALSPVEKAHLRELSTLFLYEKNFVAAQGFQLTDAICVSIAAQACLPILRLGFNCLSGWREVIVYSEAFRVSRDSVDAAGIVHQQEQILAGESWARGPLIVSWADVERDRLESHAGRNVVIHEIAHKLDALNGSTNGFPPLHPAMSISQWSDVLNAAYQHLVQRLEHHHHTSINAYAATSPAEFFAVISEYFFCAPDILHTHYADVYQQLQLYYQQNPLLRQ